MQTTTPDNEMRTPTSKSTLDLLKRVVSTMGGTVVAASGQSVGFVKHGKQGRTIYKVVVEGDAIALYQVSGVGKGHRAHVMSLKDLKSL